MKWMLDGLGTLITVAANPEALSGRAVSHPFVGWERHILGRRAVGRSAFLDTPEASSGDERRSHAKAVSAC